MTITATVIADSISEHSPRLTTFQLRYPKFIHGEFMTHRVFSRNASSSRAIPVKRLIQDVMDDPAIPIHWGANQKGMQADRECDKLVYVGNWGGITQRTSQDAWILARDNAVKAAEAFDEAGYHKQIVNRLLEPFVHINVVCTATNYSNFFALRRHKYAQPEMKALADAMWEAMENSSPHYIEPGEWHLPYVIPGEEAESNGWHPNTPIALSVARCARVSYKTTDGRTPDVMEDLALYDRLVGSVPLHASPAEHQATPDSIWPNGDWCRPEEHGNIPGWRQYRKTLPGECQ